MSKEPNLFQDERRRWFDSSPPHLFLSPSSKNMLGGSLKRSLGMDIPSQDQNLRP